MLSLYVNIYIYMFYIYILYIHIYILYIHIYTRLCCSSASCNSVVYCLLIYSFMDSNFTVQLMHNKQRNI